MKKLFFFLCIGLILGCESSIEKVDKSFEDGSAAVVGIYSINKDTVRIGEKHFYEGGQLRMLAYFDKDGQRQGRWDYYYEDGTLWSTCEYSKGLKHGKSEVYFLNGQLRYEGKYLSDQPVEGSFSYYDEQGNLVRNE